MRGEVRRMRIWAGTWGSLYGATTVIQLGRALGTSDRDVQIDAGIGAAGAFIGAAVIGLMPQKILLDQPRLERRLARARPDEDPCAALAEAERLFLRSEAGERFGQGALVQGGNFAFNIGLGVLLIVGFDHFNVGLITTGVGIVVGEIQIFTQPTGLVRDLARYRRGELGEGGRSRASWAILPIVSRDRYGLQLSLGF